LQELKCAAERCGSFDSPVPQVRQQSPQALPPDEQDSRKLLQSSEQIHVSALQVVAYLAARSRLGTLAQPAAHAQMHGQQNIGGKAICIPIQGVSLSLAGNIQPPSDGAALLLCRVTLGLLVWFCLFERLRCRCPVHLSQIVAAFH